MRSDRLSQLADFLAVLSPDKFDFNNVLVCTTRGTIGCGTVGCAMGWTPTVFPALVKICDPRDYTGSVRYLDIEATELLAEEFGCFDDTGRIFGYTAVAAALFDMDAERAHALFTPRCPSPADDSVLRISATPKMVADRLRTFVDWYDKNGR